MRSRSLCSASDGGPCNITIHGPALRYHFLSPKPLSRVYSVPSSTSLIVYAGLPLSTGLGKKGSQRSRRPLPIPARLLPCHVPYMSVSEP